MTTEPWRPAEEAGGNVERLANTLTAAFCEVAVALGGLRSTGSADTASDIDLYVYATAEVPVWPGQGERLLAATAASSADELDRAIGSLCDELDGLSPEMLRRQRLEADPALANRTYRPPSLSIIKLALSVVADAKKVSHPDS